MTKCFDESSQEYRYPTSCYPTQAAAIKQAEHIYNGRVEAFGLDQLQQKSFPEALRIYGDSKSGYVKAYITRVIEV